MHIRNWIALGHDVAAAMIAWYLAYWLRFNTEIPQYNIPNMVGAMLWVVPRQARIFFVSGKQGVSILAHGARRIGRAGLRTGWPVDAATWRSARIVAHNPPVGALSMA